MKIVWAADAYRSCEGEGVSEDNTHTLNLKKGKDGVIILLVGWIQV